MIWRLLARAKSTAFFVNQSEFVDKKDTSYLYGLLIIYLLRKEDRLFIA